MPHLQVLRSPSNNLWHLFIVLVANEECPGGTPCSHTPFFLLRSIASKQVFSSI
ncbi:MAG: hypothetical protein JGK01_00780 [Microcoleus sp. PH2017_03_ELD_O_A]|uniref:hypothetical protein n=1 Tax=unclassified Microcoleus TaxID=2642155 RepID=UPI001D8E3259|nr:MULTISPECIES: hypothetical protein [unclassified Microcoleus]MCC3440363.1 hypothetical protein [Microcoleus sp. PH2017_03_ELD_O_A]MCC3464780.1 hypothetical protein [Microcoleus sp. PH2017_06_SFM_O_A]MCC3501444.1 hypothetical protein [Microcoleus sp. PH2017_19_SFW_U_A]MCC3552051.1 hypothetical protein [Microcoleus sp. PH2017_35_SFW_U_B]MCC3568874.1 hypothetical protein [Microcoleus sp. PH2017_31_RDM_U_A]